MKKELEKYLDGRMAELRSVLQYEDAVIYKMKNRTITLMKKENPEVDGYPHSMVFIFKKLIIEPDPVKRAEFKVNHRDRTVIDRYYSKYMITISYSILSPEAVLLMAESLDHFDGIGIHKPILFCDKFKAKKRPLIKASDEVYDKIHKEIIKK
jgi:hypothetical protein